MLRRVALVRTDVSEELRASFIRVTRIGELGTTLAVTSNRRTLVLVDCIHLAQGATGGAPCVGCGDHPHSIGERTSVESIRDCSFPVKKFLEASYIIS
jgi:hypothetical protein